MHYETINNLKSMEEQNEIPEGYEPFVEKLKLMSELASVLRDNKVRKGYIDFDRFFEYINKIGYKETFTVEATAFDSNGVIDIHMLNKQFEFIKNKMD